MFIPEVTTTVRVKIDTSDFDKLASIANPLGCFDELITDLQNRKQELDNLQDPVAESISTTLSEYQRQIISMKHYRTGMMANSVDVSQDGDGIYLVGPTASSVDGFPYPLAIETGRREVYPINAKYLRWWDNAGNIIFSKYSSAVSADPYVQPSIDNTEEDVEQIINSYVDNILG